MRAHASNTRSREQEHQAVVRHFIPPISMTVCQVKGSTPKLKQYLSPYSDALTQV